MGQGVGEPAPDAGGGALGDPAAHLRDVLDVSNEASGAEYSAPVVGYHIVERRDEQRTTLGVEERQRQERLASSTMAGWRA